jgi:transcriptional regulator with XRE-family HTH domain
LPDHSHLRERRKLAEQLKAAREGSGTSGNRFAETLGWTQPRVSRIETGGIFPTEDDVRTWASATGADEAALLAQRDRARAEYATWKEQGVGSGKQASIAQLERASEIVAKFQPVIVPSQLRTAGYAAGLLTMPLGPTTWGLKNEEIPARLAAQMDRQKILYEPGRLFRIVILEAALGTRLVDVPTMAGQLSLLLATAVGGLPALDFRIVPASAQVPVFPLSGFVIFDDHLVSIETITGEQRVSDPEEVKAYQDAFGLLYEAGVGGRAAGDLIRAALASLGDL